MNGLTHFKVLITPMLVQFIYTHQMAFIFTPNERYALWVYTYPTDGAQWTTTLKLACSEFSQNSLR